MRSPTWSRPLRPYFAPQDLGARRVKVRYGDTNYQLLGAVVEATDAIGFLRALHADPDGRLATMTAGWHRFGLPRDRAAVLTPGWPIQYGLGIMRFRPPRLLNAGRASPGADRPHRLHRLMGLPASKKG